MKKEEIIYPENIDRNIFAKYVWRRINKKIKALHVFAVVHIIFEELLLDLIEGKKIKIQGFGSMILKQHKQKKYFDFQNQKVMQSAANKRLAFKLAPKLKKKLVEMIDIDKTFGQP